MHQGRLTKTSQWVRDEENQKREKRRKQIQEHHNQKIQWAKEQEADCVWVENDYISPANEEAQLGKILNTIDFENKLRLLVPNLYFMENPFNRSMKALYLIQNGQKEYLGAYHAGFMPEHSIVKVKKELVWDPIQTLKPLERKDLPKSEWIPGQGLVFTDGKRPGWKEIKKPAGELKRGWRTILTKLVLRGLLSPIMVEMNFGEPSSLYGKKAWGYYSGKRTDYQMAF